nr:site-specific integrase [Brevundimonas sp. Leaf280]
MIPADLRAMFGKSEFKVALNTKDENEAVRVGAPILADWSDQIAKAQDRSVLASAPLQRQAIDRDRAFAAIQRWTSFRLKAALNEAFNGGLEPAPVGFSDEMREHVQRVGDLRSGDWSKVADFDAKLAEALNSQRIMCDPLHPAIPAMRGWFASALADVENGIMEYRRGRLSDAPDASSPTPVLPVTVELPVNPSPAAHPVAGMKLLDLLDRWEAAKGKSEKRHRGYVTRLSEFLGDPDVSQITPLQMDSFLIELKRFPNTKRDIEKTPFMTAIAEAEKRDDYRVLHIKTVWNWTVVYKALFEFAVDRDLMRKNPAAKMMKKPAADESEERDPYEAEDLATIFKTPMFQGAVSALGYRNTPGSLITKDHKYWLPIIALWTGGRVEELASLDVSEIKTEEEISFIDLTGRPLKGLRRVKNASARRIIPIHDRLIALGFMKYVAERKSGLLFPELDGDAVKMSVKFGKWWGLWCENVAKVKGEGLDDPQKVFHSFRHSWKRAARMSDAKEEIHDLISGHKDGNSVARGYGRGVDLMTLKAAMDLIDFPAFPTLPK